MPNHEGGMLNQVGGLPNYQKGLRNPDTGLLNHDTKRSRLVEKVGCSIATEGYYEMRRDDEK